MNDTESKKNWKGYEELIHQIYKELEPVADVKLDDHIMGINSQTLRQIDVSIRSSIAGHDILIIIQAKNHKKRADIKVVDEFAAVISDVQASKGILICSAGFTKNAKEYAKKMKIDVCSAHDASIKEWQTELQIPVIKKSIKVKITIRHHFVPVGEISIDGIQLPLPEIAIKTFMEKWEKDEISKEPGKHMLYLDRESIQFRDDLIPIQNAIEYEITHRHHFKFFVPVDYRGIKDYITQNFNAAFMAFNENIPFLNDGTWKYIESPDQILVKTTLLNIEFLNIDFLKRKMIRINWDKKA